MAVILPLYGVCQMGGMIILNKHFSRKIVRSDLPRNLRCF